LAALPCYTGQWLCSVLCLLVPSVRAVKTQSRQPAQSTRAAQASPHSHTHASAGRRTMAYIMKQHLFLHIVKSTQRCTAFVVLLFLWLRLRFKSHYGPPHSAALRLLCNPQVVLLWVRLCFESLRLTRPHEVSYLPLLSFNSINESAVWFQGCGSNTRAWLSWFFSCMCKRHARYQPPARFRIRQRCHALHFNWDFIDLHTRLREASTVLLSAGHHAQNIRIYRPSRSPRARFALRSSADPLAPTPSELMRPFRTTSRDDAFADDPAPAPRLAATTTTLAASE
jgi:hypothetical protein